MTDRAHATLADELRSLIGELFLDGRPDVELGDDDRFLELGVIDSLGLIELVEQIRTRYGIDVEDVEITEENFGSIAALARYVDAKHGE